MIYIAFGFAFFVGYMFGIITVALMAANDRDDQDRGK